MNQEETGGEAFTAVVIADVTQDDTVFKALALSRARVLARMSWDAAAAELASIGARPILVVEASGIDPATLDATLPRIDGYASALELAVIVALDTAQIDAVTAHLLGPHIHLLCEPTLADRTAALVVAAEQMRGYGMSDRVREGEAVRLERLNSEVARIAEVLARLARPDISEDPDDIVADRRQSFGLEGYGAARETTARDIRRTIRQRRLRDTFFAGNLFEDPAWDMLLDLFAAELERAKVSVSSLCIAAAVAPTTALRWITRMTEAGLFERRPDPRDRRRAFMVLSPSASEAMRRYFATAARQETIA